MNAHETEIRRNADGSIDTAYYVRHCHRQRSLAAHKAIGQFLVMISALIGGTLKKEQHPLKADVTRSLSKQQQDTNLDQMTRKAA